MKASSHINTKGRVKVFETHLKKMPLPLQKGFIALKEQESQIAALLKTAEGQASFKADPIASLEKAGIKVDPHVKQALRKNMHLAKSFLAPEKFSLPTGQVIAPKVNIRFTT